MIEIIQTLCIKLNIGLLDRTLQPIARFQCTFQRRHTCYRCDNLMAPMIPQHLEHLEMLLLRSRFLEDLAPVADDDGVGSHYDYRLALFHIVNLPLIHVQCLFRRRLKDIFERGHVFGEIFGEIRGDDVDLGEAYLDDDD